ncbi:Flp pilus assembly protein TadD [Pseudoxanthomonas japonensis]|uniref:tetratricopeptide repeat protein n=1 Tax=Pseudoxanthomonas japonensis TaxID=69284 RepID=UPI002863BF9F|nr:tetratricopeptide repeat protein [Pseudoxanthomonas japonensis]MDR7067193.1 Flp pilus assembly protein TadD [Pseudoxanthomonas japonensis]
MIATLMAATLAVAGLVPAPVAPPVPAAQPPTPIEVMALPEPLRQQFHAKVLSTPRGSEQRLRRMVEFLFSPDDLGMSYDIDANHTVSEAYATRKANCLSFTLLAIALAREAGLQAYGQQIDETLAWRQEQDTLYRTNHVNAGVRIQDRLLTVDVAWDEVIARKPPRRISDKRLLVHYYNNRAADLLEAGRLEDALRYAEVAKAMDPGYAVTWSNTGVLHLRHGDPVQAEQHYLHALQLDPQHPGALSNLAAHYQRTGNTAAAARLQARLHRVQAMDPFHHFMQGVRHERERDFERAVRDYRQAIKLFPDEHRFHFGLARVHFQMGDHRRAGKALARAERLSEGGNRRLYHAKLDALRRLQH